MKTIEVNNLIHSYTFDGVERHSLNDISMTIHQGEFVAVLGHNGCGKTTLARHLNALIPLQSGAIKVAGLDASCKATLWEIRKKCGMVFQNPDNQFVSSIIEEDIAFGLYNFGLDKENIPKRIREALEIVGMSGYEKKSPHLLSGGQKQRIAVAGVLATEPDIIVFDEVTSMLDPQGREDVLETIHKLHQRGKTIVMITHYMEEAVAADRIFLMHKGALLAQGTPSAILTDIDLLKQTGLTPPLSVRAYFDLKKAGIVLGKCPLTKEDLVKELCQLH